jgi:tetratricopeptide (TPR) repeat protein
MISRAIAIIAAVAVIALGAAPLRAQPARAPQDAARVQAASHVRQGQAFFQHGDFDRALAEYQAALDLSAEPSLVFNIALCHDRANRPEDALKAFQRYIALAPDGSVADEARSDIARLIPIVEKIQAERDADAARRQAEDARHALATRQAEDARRRDAEIAGRIRLSRYALIGGAALAAGGGVAHVLAWRTRDHMTETREPDSYLDDRRRFAIERGIAIGAYAAGALAIAAGLVLAYTAPSPRDTAPRVSAAVVPGGAAMVVEWSR